MPAYVSFFPSSESQQRWREHMRLNYLGKLDIPPCVFRVPDELKEAKPEAYVPQVIGLGPYNHFRPEVQRFSSRKRDAVKYYLRDHGIADHKFVDLIERDHRKEITAGDNLAILAEKEHREETPGITDDKLGNLSGIDNKEEMSAIADDNVANLPGNEHQEEIFLIADDNSVNLSGKNQREEICVIADDNSANQADKDGPGFEPIIRSCYDQYLDLDRETLSWIVIVDGLVLLHFIHTYIKPEDPGHKVYSNVEKLVPDVWMLENQIPIILLIHMKKILGLTDHLNVEPVLFDEFYRFCQMLSPLRLPVSAQSAFDKNSHILHFLYEMIMQDAGSSEYIATLTSVPSKNDRESWGHKIAAVGKVAADHVGELYYQVVDEFKSAMDKAEDAGLKVPGNVKKISQFLKRVEKTFEIQNNNSTTSRPVLLDGNEIPSVSRLATILNIKFKPVLNGIGIGGIDLLTPQQQEGRGEDTAQQQVGRVGGRGGKYKFYLPVLTIGPHTEVVFRNLVAYEAAISKDQENGSTRLRDYVDLMCGLIKSDKDVELLENTGIIKLTKGFSKGQVINVCNGIRKSDTPPDDKSKVHRTVKTTIDHFNNTAFVKCWRAFMKFVVFMVKMFRSMFPFLIFAFLAFQSACDVFDCRRIIHPNYGVSATRDLFLGDSGLELNPQTKLMLPRKFLPN